MSNKDIDQARKLSNNEMEGQKGGATKSRAAYANLEKFFVRSNASTAAVFRGDLNADSVMCAGQTRSGDITLNPSQLEQFSQLRSGGFTLKF